VSSLQLRFLALLPRIERHGRIYFRNLRCPDRKEEALQEMRALAWLWFLRLVNQGKDPANFPSALARFAARRVQVGRNLCDPEKAHDVLSPRAQRNHGFAVGALTDLRTTSGGTYNEALHDNTRTPPPEQVAFRCDFAAWRQTRTDRDRRIMDALMVGGRTLDLARKYGVTPTRISQMRREFKADWARFCGERTPEPVKA
jgi:hypothetical protein